MPHGFELIRYDLLHIRSSMPHGFELECAGVVGGQVTLCNGSVVLRLEESDDGDAKEP